MRVPWKLLLVPAALVVGYLSHCPPPPPPFDSVTVTPEQIAKDRPKPRSEQSLPQKLTTKVIRPTVEARTPLPSAPNPQWQGYCTPAIDTVHDTVVVKERQLPPVEFRYGNNRLQFWSVSNDQSEYYSEHRVRAPFSAVAVNGSLEVTGSRFPWVGTGLRCLAAGAGGALLGAALDGTKGAAIGGVAACGATVAF